MKALVLALTLALIPAVHAQDFKSTTAVTARNRRTSVIVQSREEYVAALKATLPDVTKSRQLEEANRISKCIAEPDANINEPLTSLRGKAAQAKFKAAVQRANQEYLVSLKGALRVSMQTAQLDENNLISAEIKKIEDAAKMEANTTAGFINLLAMIDPEKNKVAGKWRMEKGALLSSGEGEERLQIPYEVPAEYDFQISFTKTGSNCVIQNLSGNERQFIWVMSENGNFTFHYVKGAGIGANKTTVKKPAGIKDNHRYTSLVKVRKNGAEAYLDGKLITKWETDFKDAEPAPFWALRNGKCLGVSSGASAVTFHSIEVREITGQGRQLK